MDGPESAADPRPNEEPYYIDTECPECGEDLILNDELTYEQKKSSDALADPDFEDKGDSIWHDEWVCPECLDGVHMDWPEEQKDAVFGRMEDTDEEDFVSLEDIEEALDL